MLPATLSISCHMRSSSAPTAEEERAERPAWAKEEAPHTPSNTVAHIPSGWISAAKWICWECCFFIFYCMYSLKSCGCRKSLGMKPQPQEVGSHESRSQVSAWHGSRWLAPRQHILHVSSRTAENCSPLSLYSIWQVQQQKSSVACTQPHGPNCFWQQGLIRWSIIQLI